MGKFLSNDKRNAFHWIDEKQYEPESFNKAI